MREREKTIYDLHCNESLIHKETIEITRVPGGWIYEFIKCVGIRHTFVPFNDEFNPNRDPFHNLPTRLKNAWGKLGVQGTVELLDYTGKNSTWPDELVKLPGVGRNCILMTRTFLSQSEN